MERLYFISLTLRYTSFFLLSYLSELENSIKTNKFIEIEDRLKQNDFMGIVLKVKLKLIHYPKLHFIVCISQSKSSQAKNKIKRQ